MAKIQTAALFPILPSRPVGLARLAAESTHAQDGFRIEFKAMRARSILNRSVSKRQLSLAWSINPFRGCEFGCRYCYARYTHEFLRPEPIARIPIGAYDAPPQPWAIAFEHEIYLKENAAWLLEQELKKVEPGEEIAIGTATDPYQPIERRVGITRSLLEILANREGHRIGIVSKSTLIERDIDLLQRIAAKNTLVVHLTITTADAGLARKLEPRAPRPDLRFAAVKKLRAAGITAGVLCSPLLPGINDTPRALDAVASRAAAAGASFLGAHPLFLKSCSRPTWMSFVREHFPHLLEQYRQLYDTRDFTDAVYRRKMASIVRAACRKHGIPPRSTDALLSRDPGSTGAGTPARTPPKKPSQTVRTAGFPDAAHTAQRSLFATG
ncbi:MAG TPA: radical SAM protein [Acidobacteriaceae bacterium]|jgi:DNA repair photolyase|nr:radical SAM protein [Acidobacteriaceae bacterium]